MEVDVRVEAVEFLGQRACVYDVQRESRRNNNVFQVEQLSLTRYGDCLQSKQVSR